MQKLKIFISDSHIPQLNLATEEWIFHHMDPTSQVLFLWRNEPTVVIGRNQNPWSECNLSQMKAEKVHLARRTTGGGAVFQDLGNTNFTFLSPKKNYSKANNNSIIIEALKDLGIKNAEASGRNDLVLPFEDGPRKFSGSAFREKQDRAFHHGTMLMHADLARLGQLLTPNPKKLQAKGKESVRARVVNLNEINPDIQHDILVEKIIQSFQNFYQSSAQPELLNIQTLQEIPELKLKYEELNSWQWLYGNTLEFSHQMTDYLSLGLFEFQFKVVDGIISDLQIFTDSLYPKLIEDLIFGLKDKNYEAQSILNQFEKLEAEYSEIKDGLVELKSWLIRQIEI